MAKARQADGRVVSEVLAWVRETLSADGQTVRQQLKAWLPEYRTATDTSRDVVVPFDRSGRRQALGDGGGNAGLGGIGHVTGGVNAGH